VRSIAALLPTLLCLGACASFARQDQSLRKVDNLVERIERVHLESELSKARMREGLASLAQVADPNMKGDVSIAYADFVKTVEASEKQAKALRAAVEPMKRSAKPFFQQWSDDLQDFTDQKMRKRSRTRLNETRERYEAIVAAVDPALAGYELFNQSMRDNMLFLGNDFNPTSVAMVRGDVRSLTRQAAELDGYFDACLDAARAYVQQAALPTEVAEEAPSSKP
jgi:hypothetical protein